MEIVSPVNGSLDCAKKALDCGADALYAGVRRKNNKGGRFISADNCRSELFSFKLKRIENLVSLCHRQKKKTYIALNAIYSEEALKQMNGLLLALRESGVDGVIASDLGLIKTINLNFPSLPVHASVFTSPCNSHTLSFLKELKIKRVILEDKLPIEEVANIRKNTDMEIEVFATRNFCFSYQRHCFISNYLFGRSCLVSCLERYRLKDAEGQLTKNIRLKPEMEVERQMIIEFLRIGVDAIKIEGRQRATGEICSLTRRIKEALVDSPATSKNICPKNQLGRIFSWKVLGWILFRQLRCAAVFLKLKIKKLLPV